MKLSVSRQPQVIPSYSLTGDLLSYLKCGLQYRYHNKGALPPSKPIQLWFGEFIHAVMEEAYLRWRNGQAPRQFPWDWAKDIRPIELEINRRLAARGLCPPFRLFCPYDGANTRCFCINPAQQNHQLIASKRTEAAINTWGPHLFPLIAEAEVSLQGIRPMPSLSAQPRADYYEITGVVDVIGSVQLAQAPRGNLILHYLSKDPAVQRISSQLGGSAYEIILDYKGMRRPSVTSATWQHYEWQVLTYAWLRDQQPNSNPVVAGIILFINELEPSGEEMEELQQDVLNHATDIMPQGNDYQAIVNWKPGRPIPTVSTPFREQRSIRIIAVSPNAIQQGLQEFDDVVSDIENSVLAEMAGQSIIKAWQKRPSGSQYTAPERRTCTACDFKYFCPLAPQIKQGGPPLAP